MWGRLYVFMHSYIFLNVKHLKTFMNRILVAHKNQHKIEIKI